MRKCYFIILLSIIFVAVAENSHSDQKSIEILNNQLKEAIESNNPNKVELALKNGANPNAVKLFGTWTPLLKATSDAAIGDLKIEIVKLLIAYGADVNRSGYDQMWFPLYVATLQYNLKSGRDVISFLLQAGADPNKRFGGKKQSSYEWLRDRCKLDDDCERFPEMKKEIAVALKIFDEFMKAKKTNSSQKTRINYSENARKTCIAQCEAIAATCESQCAGLSDEGGFIKTSQKSECIGKCWYGREQCIKECP